jgi:hypothetical protein
VAGRPDSAISTAGSPAESAWRGVQITPAPLERSGGMLGARSPTDSVRHHEHNTV